MTAPFHGRVSRAARAAHEMSVTFFAMVRIDHSASQKSRFRQVWTLFSAIGEIQP
jgi:hypothetical protein